MDDETNSLVKAFLKKHNSIEIKKPTLPYYNEKEALIVKSIVDKVLASGKPLKLVPKHVSLSTVRLQYYQGLSYLRDKIDAKYKDIKLVCRTYRQFGYVEILPGSQAASLQDAAIQEVADYAWKDELLVWLDSRPDLAEKFVRVDLALSIEEQQWIKDQLKEIEHLYIWEITGDKITIIRYPRE